MSVKKTRSKANRKRSRSNLSTTMPAMTDQVDLYREFKRLDFGSVFDVLSISKPNFIHLYDEKLEGKAEHVYDWATYYANYIAHRYRAGDDSDTEKRPLPSESNTADTADRDQSMDFELFKQPTYEHLFPEDRGMSVCHPDSMKAQTSPTAYLVDLYQFVKTLGNRSENQALAEPIKELFAERRPDLESLCLNEKNATEAISGLELVNSILSEAVKKNVATEMPEGQTLDEFFAYSVYPFELPFYLPYVQILKSLQQKKLSLATIIQQLDQRYPYFFDKNVARLNRSSFFNAYSYLTPTQTVAVTSNGIPHSPDVNSDPANFPLGAYLIEYYGLYHSAAVNDAIKGLLVKLKKGEKLSDAEQKQFKDCEKSLSDELRLVPNFLKQTDLTPEALNQLLSRKQYAPKLSKHVVVKSEGDIYPATPVVYGSSYINSCGNNTLVIVADPHSGENEKIEGGDAGFRFFQAMNRFLRFQKYTGAKPNELDWLISSFAANDSAESDSCTSIESAVSAFGFYRYLQTRYTLSLEEFTALVYRICPYSIGDELSQFDRLFNTHSENNQPALVLDGSEFDVQSNNLADQQTIQQLCMGLNIDHLTFQRIAVSLKERVGLTRSLKTVSWFYKIVKMSRLFGFTVLEFLLLIERAGTVLKYDTSDKFFSFMVVIDQMAIWLKQHRLTFTQFMFLVNQRDSSFVVATPQAMNLFNELKQALEDKEIEKETETEANTVLSQSLIKLYLMAPALAPHLVRWLGNDFSLSILSEVEKIKDKVSDQTSLQKEGSKFLSQVTVLERHLLVVNVLKLSNTELQLLNEHPEYFAEPEAAPHLEEKEEGRKQAHTVYHESISKLHHLDPDLASNLAQLIGKDFSTPLLTEDAKPASSEPAPLTLRLIYLLTRLKDWLAFSAEPEEKLLSYFGFANTSPLDQAGKEHCTALLAESLHWDSSEVKFLFSRLTNSDSVAKTMSDIDWVLRIRELCTQTGLSASQLLKLNTLKEDVPYSDVVQLANALRDTSHS